MDHHDEELMNCVRTKMRKNEEVTRNKLHERCPVDFRTAKAHLEHIVNKDLGDGTKVVRGQACHPALIRDPPNEKEIVIEVDPPHDLPPNDSSADFFFGAVVGIAFTVTVALLTSFIQREHHVHSWAPFPGAIPWLCVCHSCGVRARNLNDQSAPIHFTSINS